MDHPSLPSPAGVGPVDRHIDQVCDRFEQAWKDGRFPPVEDFLDEAADGQRSALMRELILVETAYRRMRGDELLAEEYQKRFPELGRAWIATAIELERAHARREETAAQDSTVGPGRSVHEGREPPRQIRCPKCHSPILLGDRQSDEVLCPGCGGSFRIRDARRTTADTPIRQGKFALLERVGLGAFGAVWRARDTELDREVALKIPHSGLSISGEELQRFQEEARKLAQLRHPGIVTVHEVATLQGLPVIVSDFIRGVPLSDLLEQRQLTFRESATLLVAVADALDYVHSRGVVHRDVKPANIMVEYHAPGANGEAVVDLSRPLLLDFGLALYEQAPVTLTMDGQIIGTPAYMSPEQAARRGHQADRRSDVFSLGVILYELLCGELPFRGSKLMILNQVLYEEPRPPRKINDAIPRDLETICLKSMSKEPGLCYSSAKELVDELRRFLAGEPIHARPIGKLEQAIRWCRRNLRDSALIGTVFVLLALLAVGATIAAVQINRGRNLAEQRRREAESQFEKTLETVDLLTRVAQEAAENTPRMEESQLRSLERARHQLTALLADKPAHLHVRRKLALLYERMGRIWWMNGETGRARESLHEAAGAFLRLAEEHPEDKPFYDHHGAVCQNELGETYRHTHERAKAKSHYDLALAVQKEVAGLASVEQLPLSERIRELARTENNLGLLLWEGGKFADAEEFYNDALVRLGPVAVEPDCRSGYAQLHINRGNVYFTQNRNALADGDYGRAIDLLEALNQRFPSKHDYQFRLGVACNNRGRLLRNSNPSKALMYSERARVVLTRLAENFPRYHLYRKELAQAWNNAGICRWEARDDRAGAKSAFLKAWRVSWELAVNPGLPEYKHIAADCLNSLAVVALAEKKLEEVRRCCDGAIPLEEAALAAKPDNPVFLRDLVKFDRTLAESLATPGEPLRAPHLLVRRALAVGADPRLPSKGRAEATEQLAQKAVELLGRFAPQLRQRGEVAGLESSEDWQLLRGRKDFEDLRKKLKAGK